MKNALLLLLLGCASSAFAQTASSTAKAADTTLSGLPVLRSYVAPEVVFRAKKKYGRALYCIEKSTAADCQNSYLVGLLHNGRLNMAWMCDDPKMVWNRAGAADLAAR